MKALIYQEQKLFIWYLQRNLIFQLIIEASKSQPVRSHIFYGLIYWLLEPLWQQITIPSGSLLPDTIIIFTSIVHIGVVHYGYKYDWTVAWHRPITCHEFRSRTSVVAWLPMSCSFTLNKRLLWDVKWTIISQLCNRKLLFDVEVQTLYYISLLDGS